MSCVIRVGVFNPAAPLLVILFVLLSEKKLDKGVQSVMEVVVCEAIVKGHSKMNDEFLELPFQHLFHFFVLIDEILVG